jgi:phosphate-selective porin OprO/OprP
VKSQINKQWQAELEVSFNGRDSGMVVDDAYITSNLSKYLTLTIGNAKEPFGLEKLTGLKYIPTIERSMATSAFAPGQQPGLGLSGRLYKFTWAMGIFETDDGQDSRRTHALTGRLTFAPWSYRNRVLHFGLAGSSRNFHGGEYKILEAAEVHTSDEIITSAGVRADRVNLLGLEAACIIGPFSLRGEHMTLSVKTENGNNPGYSGYYLSGSYFLTGQSYEYKEGTFRGWKSQRSINISEHSPDRRPVVMNKRDRDDALELVIRYSVLDAEHGNTGVWAANLTAGINYYINKKTRFMVNYIHTDLAGNLRYHEDKAKAISLRMQYAF